MTVTPINARRDLIQWTCAVCESPVADGDGCLTVSLVAAEQAAASIKAWDEAHPNGALLGEIINAYPGPTPWLCLHHACNDDPDDAVYERPVEDLRTPACVLSVTAHLMGKSWLQYTDWDDVIAGIGQRSCR